MNMRKLNIDKDKSNLNDKSKHGNSEETQTQKLKNTILNESGGPQGLEPTRYGDWEQKGRCTDF